jgi:flagellar motor switch protein FliN/FliY
MSENEAPESGDNEMSDDEKLAAEWESAMSESGDNSGNVEDEWAAAMAESEQAGSEQVGGADKNVTAAPLEKFDGHSQPPRSAEGNPDLDIILDIPVTISMEVGNTSIPIRNLLQLNQGSVIELDRLAGEPLDVLVNGTLIAHGEVVMVNEKFGIRLTDVVSPSERIKRLK